MKLLQLTIINSITTIKLTWVGLSRV